jgi:hypothetical protein
VNSLPDISTAREADLRRVAADLACDLGEHMGPFVRQRWYDAASSTFYDALVEAALEVEVDTPYEVEQHHAADQQADRARVTS